MLHTITLDLDHFAQDFKYIHKVALKYSDRYPKCGSSSSNFRCLHSEIHGTPDHLNWRMCPYELCGLLSNLPHLREFYIILEPSRKKVDQEPVEVYIKNYFSRNTIPITASHPTIPISRRQASNPSSSATHFPSPPFARRFPRHRPLVHRAARFPHAATQRRRQCRCSPRDPTSQGHQRHGGGGQDGALPRGCRP